jgi:hypothetical protein
MCALRWFSCCVAFPRSHVCCVGPLYRHRRCVYAPASNPRALPLLCCWLPPSVGCAAAAQLRGLHRALQGPVTVCMWPGVRCRRQVVFGLFVTLWTTVFLEDWKRRQATLAFQWGMEGGSRRAVAPPFPPTRRLYAPTLAANVQSPSLRPSWGS